MCGYSMVELDWPTVTCKHGGIQATLIANFHDADVMTETLPLLVAHITNIFWKMV